MHYLRSLVPALAFAASIDARAFDHLRARGKRYESGMTAPNSTDCPGAGSRGRVLYTLTNQDENSVIAMRIQNNGTLTPGSIFPTGGQGATIIDMMTGLPVLTDSLNSQSAITVAGSNLFAVNAGSNSLSMFAIDPRDPARLTLVGEPVETGGDFPTSVAASLDLRTVCVAHTGAAAGISCAKYNKKRGLSAFDLLRPYNLQQTNPPTGPLNGIGTTFFNEESTSLVTLVKGDPTDPSGAFPGFVSVFLVDPITGTVATQDTQTTPSGTAVLFGGVTIPGTNNALVSDAAFGAAILDLGNLTQPVATTVIPNQGATCWSVYYGETNTGFVTDPTLNRLVEVDAQTGELILDLQVQNSNRGMLDLSITGEMLYALAPGNGTMPPRVAVFDISGGRASAREVQNFLVPGASNTAMSLAYA